VISCYRAACTCSGIRTVIAHIPSRKHGLMPSLNVVSGYRILVLDINVILSSLSIVAFLVYCPCVHHALSYYLDIRMHLIRSARTIPHSHQLNHTNFGITHAHSWVRMMCFTNIPLYASKVLQGQQPSRHSLTAFLSHPFSHHGLPFMHYLSRQ